MRLSCTDALKLRWTYFLKNNYRFLLAADESSHVGDGDSLGQNVDENDGSGANLGALADADIDWWRQCQ